MSIKRVISLLLLFILSLSLSACGKEKNEQNTQSVVNTSSSTENTDNTNEFDGLEEFDIVLDWYPNAVHTFLYNAIEKGYFADEGLKVNILFPANNNDAISLSAAGKADAGLYYQNDVIMAKVNNDVPVVIIGTVVQDSLDIIAYLKEKNISRPKDLEGKTLGYSSTEFGEAVIKRMLENDNSSIDNIKLVDVGFDLMSSMTTENVDATFGCFVNHEIPQLEKEGFEMGYFKLSDFGIPNYYSLVFVAGSEKLNQNPEKYKRFLKACSKGFYDMKNDPEGSLEILLSNQNTENFPLDGDVEKKSIEILMPMMEKEYSNFISQDINCYKENIDWLYENNLIDKKIEPNEIMKDVLNGEYYFGEWGEFINERL